VRPCSFIATNPAKKQRSYSASTPRLSSRASRSSGLDQPQTLTEARISRRLPQTGPRDRQKLDEGRTEIVANRTCGSQCLVGGAGDSNRRSSWPFPPWNSVRSPAVFGQNLPADRLENNSLFGVSAVTPLTLLAFRKRREPLKRPAVRISPAPPTSQCEPPVPMKRAMIESWLSTRRDAAD
jgi:hypothetical protein